MLQKINQFVIEKEIVRRGMFPGGGPEVETGAKVEGTEAGIEGEEIEVEKEIIEVVKETGGGGPEREVEAETGGDAEK